MRNCMAVKLKANVGCVHCGRCEAESPRENPKDDYYDERDEQDYEEEQDE